MIDIYMGYEVNSFGQIVPLVMFILLYKEGRKVSLLGPFTGLMGES